ncbi:hypothetical protein LTR04_006482 [Oleoguttula sp. CCFEE 6159]|nr:hypothetical protein LTR04_006482 [Oleoguttula sp. CCFEE 6159]
MPESTALLGQLQHHLDQLSRDATTPLDTRLLESCSAFLADTLSREDSQALVRQLSQLLPTLQQDPTPGTSLLQKLLQPYSFSQILSFEPPVDFVAGLALEAQPYHYLVLSLLRKAIQEASNAATLASQPVVIASLIRLWLCTVDPGVADEASVVILGLLKVDQEVHPTPSSHEHVPSSGQGLVWRRLFGDRDIYRLLFSICSLKPLSDDVELQLSKSQRTLAQARLMAWLPKVGAMDWSAITKSHHPDVEQQYGLKRDQGLLDFVAVFMVDFNDDVLMHRCLIEFYADLIEQVKDVSIDG